MNFLRTCLRVVGWLLGLVVVAYLAVNLFAVGRGVLERHALAGDVTDLLADQVPAALEEQAALDTRVGRPADHQWVEQTCQRTNNDAGWFVDSYRETCELRAVSLWRTGSSAEAAELAQAGQGRRTGPLQGCERLDDTADGAEASYVVVDGAEPWCLSRSFADHRTLVGERAAVDPGGWLLVVKSSPLVDETIGCARWTLLFCDDPWGESRHAWGEAPD